MDWITQIKKRKLLIVGGVLLIAFSALLVTSLRSPVAMDPYWHLQMGEDWLENGLSPWVDHYSFTFNGHKITNPPVVFQGLLYLAVKQFGMRDGFLILRFGFFLLTLGASFLLLRQMKAPAVIYAIVVPMIVFLLQMRALVRPELLSYTLMILALMLYFRADRKVSLRNCAPMVALVLVWVNLHSPILGYVIFFGFFVDCAVAQLGSRAPTAVWVKWFSWGLLIVFVGFLNHDFSHPLIRALTFSPEWKSVINEYLPSAPFVKSIAGIYVLILFAVLTPVMAWQQRRFGMLFVSVVFTYFAVSMIRMVAPAGIVIVIFAAYLLTNSNVFHQSRTEVGNYWSRIAGVALLIAIGITLFSNVERARHYMRENRAVIGRYPVAIANYISEREMPGRILNDYGMGGYLIYRLSPQNQVYIDGRTGILYPWEHFKRYQQLFQTNSTEGLRSELDKYSIDKIIWMHSQGKHDLVYDMGGFGLDFLDARFVLYTRGTSNFQLLGKLMSRPSCWNPGMLAELDAERQKMYDILPGYSGLFRFANFVVGYTTADDGKAFFDDVIEGEEWIDEMRRFAGFRFLETGYYDLAVNLFGGVQIVKPKDYLASALAKIKAKDFEVAAQILEENSNVKWPRLRPEEIFVNYTLYRVLATQKTLTPVEQKRVKALKEQLLMNGYTDLETIPGLDVGLFCMSSKNRPSEPFLSTH